MARIVTWVCDKCGAKNCYITAEEIAAAEGWATIHLVKDGKSKHADLCPKCANRLEFN